MVKIKSRTILEIELGGFIPIQNSCELHFNHA